MATSLASWQDFVLLTCNEVGKREPVTKKLIRPAESVAWNLCKYFCRDGVEGNGEECKWFRSFIPCKMITYVFTKRPGSKSNPLFVQ